MVVMKPDTFDVENKEVPSRPHLILFYEQFVVVSQTIQQQQPFYELLINEHWAVLEMCACTFQVTISKLTVWINSWMNITEAIGTKIKGGEHDFYRSPMYIL